MIYLASPYTSASADEMFDRYYAALQCVAFLIHHKKLTVFSPIVYAHPMAVEHKLGTTAAVWERFNTHMLRQSAELYVLKIPGWDESVGVSCELDLATVLNIPWRFVDKFGEHIL